MTPQHGAGHRTSVRDPVALLPLRLRQSPTPSMPLLHRLQTSHKNHLDERKEYCLGIALSAHNTVASSVSVSQLTLPLYRIRPRRLHVLASVISTETREPSKSSGPSK